MSKPNKGAPAPKKSSRMGLVVGIAVVAVAVLIGVSVVSAPKQSKMPDQAGVSRGNTRGKDTAKVKVVEYGDYLWHFCADAHKALEPQLAAYIDRGDVQFTYKYFLNDPQNSPLPAEATECATEQGKFWAYKAAVYDHFNNKPYPKESLKQWAKDLSLDTKTFNACLDSGKYRKQVQDQAAEGTKAGVTGTPTFFINGKMVVGFDPQRIFATIDADLKK